jgi:single-strand DNA-binding protein
MNGINRLTLLGNLGADPELRNTQGGAVLNLRLATTETWLNKEKEQQSRTDWHNVVVWGKRAEALSKFLRKGALVYVEGPVRTSSYDDKDGVKRYRTEVHAMNLVPLDKRPDAKTGAVGAPKGGKAAEPATDDYTGGYAAGPDDDIPY